MPAVASTRAHAAGLAAAILAASTSCGTQEHITSAVPQDTLSQPRTVVSVESGILAAPRDLAMDSSGNVYVLDQIDQHVVAVTPDGDLRATIGSPGSGPGELSAPLALAVDARGVVRVFDFGGATVHRFSSDGASLDDYRTAVLGLPSRFSFAPDGRLAYSGTAATSQGGLVAIIDTLGAQTAVLGTLRTVNTAIPQSMLADLHAPRLPEFMRNNALPVFDPTGGLWLFLQTEGLLQHLRPDGTLDVEHSVDVPEMSIILDAYFDWYATVDAPDLLRYFEYVGHAAATKHAVWLLWNTPPGQPGLLTVHDSTGSIVARLIIRGLEPEGMPTESNPRPAFRRIAVDLERARLYLADRETATLLAFALPPELVHTVR